MRVNAPVGSSDDLALTAIESGDLIADPATGHITLRGREVGWAAKSGYIYVHLQRRPFQAHRLVWMFHHGPIDPRFELNHKNGRKWDNRLANLELVTHSGNMRHGRGEPYTSYGADGWPVLPDCEVCGVWQHLKHVGVIAQSA